MFSTFGQQNDSNIGSTNIVEMDLPTDVKDPSFHIYSNSSLQPNIMVPGVDLHSLILDFSAVSFMDISAVNGLKMVQNHCSPMMHCQ